MIPNINIGIDSLLLTHVYPFQILSKIYLPRYSTMRIPQPDLDYFLMMNLHRVFEDPKHSLLFDVQFY